MSILAKAVQATASTEQVLYTVPSLTEVMCSIQVCNRSATATALVSIGLLASGETATATSGFLEFNLAIAPSGVLERTGIVLSAGEKIAVTSNVATAVNFMVVGRAELV